MVIQAGLSAYGRYAEPSLRATADVQAADEAAGGSVAAGQESGELFAFCMDAVRRRLFAVGEPSCWVGSNELHTRFGTRQCGACVHSVPLRAADILPLWVSADVLRADSAGRAEGHRGSADNV